MIVVYTVIAGYYDHLRPPEIIEPGVRYVCFSDIPMPRCDPWEFQPLQAYVNSNRHTRLPKMLPHLYLDYDYCIYHDGCFSLRERASDIVQRYLTRHRVAMMRHPCRKDVAEEADACLRFNVGEPLEIARQVARWRSVGSPGGLWAGGFIVRDASSEAERLGAEWWEEFRRGSGRDQLALPVARSIAGVDIHTIDLSILENSLIQFRFHAANSEQQCNADLEPQRQKWLARAAEVKSLCR